MSAQHTPGPWRKVTGYKRVPGTGRAWNTLECGHRTEAFTGDKAIDAKHATRRRCADCAKTWSAA